MKINDETLKMILDKISELELRLLELESAFQLKDLK